MELHLQELCKAAKSSCQVPGPPRPSPWSSLPGTAVSSLCASHWGATRMWCMLQRWTIVRRASRNMSAWLPAGVSVMWPVHALPLGQAGYRRQQSRGKAGSKTQKGLETDSNTKEAIGTLSKVFCGGRVAKARFILWLMEPRTALMVEDPSANLLAVEGGLCFAAACSKMEKAEITKKDDLNVTDFSWKVKANSGFQETIKKKGFFCWGQKHYDNRIKTSKYTWWSFLPLNLYEQYQRAEIIYFTVLLILQCIPQISVAQPYVFAIPLLCILVSRCTRDMINDIARFRNDKLINNKSCDILKGNSFNTDKWKDVRVGDIVRLQKDDFVPADMLLLCSTEPNSLCYLETKGIDGETNLKFRQSLIVTHSALQTAKALSEFDGVVTCEEPNVRLHKFVGILEWQGKTYSLNNENILLRDCRIRNTEICYGLVIYAGFDTKIMKNCGKVTLKKTKLEYLINKTIFYIAVMLILASSVMGILAGEWDRLYMEKHTYIPGQLGMSSFFGLIYAWVFIASMSTLVPFLLYISLEGVHIIHNFFINNDIEMYHAESDSPAQARAVRLNDLLGQVEYIFTDKTGTLTENIMTFKKCCIGSRMFGTTCETEKDQQVNFDWNKYADTTFRFYDQSLIDEVRMEKDPLVCEFFRMIALCHTVMVEGKDEEMTYKASSPDEEALVTAARNFGYVFLSRNQETITISELGIVKTYHVLVFMDFSSVRKRMSILVRDPEGRIKLYTKGADSIILQRLHPSSSTDSLMDALDHFSEETLRILCLAYKEVEESNYEQWKMKHDEGCISLHNREGLLNDVYEEMENNLLILGATAIEDKLQNGVPETIELLRKGNMKIWMLTGDKPETAVNIAYSCNLFTSNMEIMEQSEIWSHLDKLLERREHSHTEGLWDNRAMVLTGDQLSDLLDSNAEEPKVSMWKKFVLSLTRKDGKNHSQSRGRALVELASRCQSVICCRVTPNQKANIVQLVKSNLNVTTLSIGDGGNDVNMIKTAHIGVGISGKEGLQAVLASDFSLAQFSYLQRLLFVHGRLSYYRLSNFLCYYMYKTFACLVNNFWYGFFNGFTALLTYDSLFLVFNSIFYTLYPALYLSILDRDMDVKKSLQHPQLYLLGQQDKHRGKRFFLYILYGIYTSLVMFFISYGVFLDSGGPKGIFDYHIFAMTMATAGILAVLAQAAIQFSSWSVFAVLSLVLSFGNYLLISYLEGTESAYLSSMVDFAFLGAFVNTISCGYIWLLMLLIVILSIIPSLCYQPWHKFTTPKLITSTSKIDSNLVLQSEIKRNSSRRRSSYAFSHCEGYGKIVTKLKTKKEADVEDVFHDKDKV
ncbi:phospholipid-transporting ATPase IC-like [Pelodytes ibericus]